MEDFTNETIDVTSLPRYEEVTLRKLHPNYWKVILINNFIVFLVLGIILAFSAYFVEEVTQNFFPILLLFFTIVVITYILVRIGYNKKGFAFRNHDVIYRSGIISTNTMVIPYNRVQHVALHEGFIARFFGLATVEIFTAGGNSSDLEIHGIEKSQAEDIKQLLMGKIQKQL
jgi:uncharacterized protein